MGEPQTRYPTRHVWELACSGYNAEMRQSKSRRARHQCVFVSASRHMHDWAAARRACSTGRLSKHPCRCISIRACNARYVYERVTPAIRQIRALAAPSPALVMLEQHEWSPVPAGELGPDLPHRLSDPTVITSPAASQLRRVGPRTPGLASRDRRQVREPGSRHLTPCVSLDPAAADQGGRGGQRQRGVDLRGGEHLARSPAIAGQQFFRAPVMLRTSNHSELLMAWAASGSGHSHGT